MKNLTKEKIILIWNQVIWYPVSRNQNPSLTELFPEQPEDQREQQTDYYHCCNWNIEFKIRLINYYITRKLSYRQLDQPRPEQSCQQYYNPDYY